MATIFIRLAVALVGVAISTPIVSAQQAVRPVSTEKGALPAVKAGAVPKGRSLINGVAVDSNRYPLKNFRVRVRNLDVNQIEQAAMLNERGEFSFAVLPEVAYVIEIHDKSGRVLAVGDMVRPTVGEVVGIVVALPSPLPALDGIFGDTASSVISAATGTGLTVMDPTLPKVSPRE